jgi:G3E family GTPase
VATAEGAKHDHDHDHDHGHVHDHDHDHGHAHKHDSCIRVFTVATETPVQPATLELFLELLRSAHGPKNLRVKGIVQLAEDPDRPLVLHMVQHVLHPPARLAAWPSEDRRSRLVFVTHDLEPDTVRRLLNAFLGTPGVDMPDKAALTENPLALNR